MTTERDSGDEIFITQSTFNTQCAAEAVDFIENEIFWNDIDDHSFPEDVVYYDFSNQRDNSSVAPDVDKLFGSIPKVENSNEGFVPIIGDGYFADDEEVSMSSVHI